MIPNGYPPGIIRKIKGKTQQHKVFQKMKCSQEKGDSFSKMPPWVLPLCKGVSIYTR
jgi:hypothetical protein